MKLLTPQQTKDLGNQQNLRQIIRTQELEKAEGQLRRQLANAEAGFNATLAQNREKWATEELEHEKRVKEREIEIKALEAKKQAALAPLNVLEGKLVARATSLDNKENALILREKDIETLGELLADKLDGVGQQEQDNLKAKQQLEASIANAKLQEGIIANNAKALTVQITEFEAYKTKVEADILERKTNVALLETSLVAKDGTLKRKASTLEEQENRIIKASALLDAKRQKALIPVATLEAEAKKLRDDANAYLEDVKAIKEIAHKDYNEKLASLDDRQKAIALEEARITALKTKAEADSKFIYKEQEKLQTAIAELVVDQDLLMADRKALEDEQKELEESLETRELALESQTTINNLTLQKAQNIEQTTLALQVKLEEMGKVQERKTIELINWDIRLKQLEQQLIDGHNQLQGEWAEFTKEQQAFAIWRSDAEKVVEDKAINNSRQSKLLARKEDKLTRQEKFLAEWAIKLKDERGLLDRTAKRLNIPLAKPTPKP